MSVSDIPAFLRLSLLFCSWQVTSSFFSEQKMLGERGWSEKVVVFFLRESRVRSFSHSVQIYIIVSLCKIKKKDQIVTNDWFHLHSGT